MMSPGDMAWDFLRQLMEQTKHMSESEVEHLASQALADLARKTADRGLKRMLEEFLALPLGSAERREKAFGIAYTLAAQFESYERRN